jgi:hypothetical protein
MLRLLESAGGKTERQWQGEEEEGNRVVSEKWICMNPQGIAAAARSAIMLLST